MLTKKADILKIDGILAESGTFNNINISKTFPESAVKRFKKPIPLFLTHEDKEPRGFIHTLTYNDTSGQIEYDGFVFDEETQNRVKSGSIGKISPDIARIFGDDRNIEDGIIISAALTNNPANRATSVNSSIMSFEGEENMSETETKTETKTEPTVTVKTEEPKVTKPDTSNTDEIAKVIVAKERIESSMREKDFTVEKLTGEITTLKSAYETTSSKYKDLETRHTALLNGMIERESSELSELGFDASDFATNLSADERLELLKGIKVKIARTQPANSPGDTNLRITEKPKGEIDIKEHAKRMGLDSELLKYIN